jgi:hypothetical protein
MHEAVATYGALSEHAFLYCHCSYLIAANAHYGLLRGIASRVRAVQPSPARALPYRVTMATAHLSVTFAWWREPRLRALANCCVDSDNSPHQAKLQAKVKRAMCVVVQ